MVKIDYDVIFNPLRFQSPALAAGKSYAARFTRRGMDYLSHIQRCRVPGEVVFAAASDPVTQAPCPVMFTELKERRTVDVEIYDFTNQRRPEKLGASSFDLIDVCDVVTRQKGRKRIEIRLRVGGKESVLEFVIIMTPSGQTPLERGGAGGGSNPAAAVAAQPAAPASVSGETRRVLPADVTKFLLERQLAGGASTGREVEIVMDEDIAQEIIGRVKQLSQRKSDPSPQQQTASASAARIRQRDELLAEVEALEDVLAGGGAAAAPVGGYGKGAGLEMDQLLHKEVQHWRTVAAQDEAARSAAQRDWDAVVLAKYEQRKQQQKQKPKISSSAQQHGGDDENRGMVAELMEQRTALQEYLSELEAQQSRRDVTAEACEALEGISNLTALIEEAQAAAQQENAAAGPSSAALEPNLSPEETEALSAIAQELLAAEVAVESHQFVLAVAQAIMQAPPARAGPAPPESLKCMSASPLFLQQQQEVSPATTTASTQGPSSNTSAPAAAPANGSSDAMSDFFAGFSASSAAAPPAATGASSKPAAAPPGLMDNLFSASTQVVAADNPPKRIAQFTAPVPTSCALPDVRCAVSPAELDFGDKSLAGYQVLLMNDSHRTLVLDGMQVLVEDLFSANEVAVDGTLYPRRLEIGANSSGSLCFGAFNQALLVCRGTLSLTLRASARTIDATRPNSAPSDARVFSIRLPSH